MGRLTSEISNPITSHMEIGCLNNAVCPGGYTARTALGACHVYCASCTTAHIYLVISQSHSKEAFRGRGPDVKVAQ